MDKLVLLICLLHFARCFNLIPSFRFYVANKEFSSVPSGMRLYQSGNPDLFSDDLFEHDSDDSDDSIVQPVEKAKKKYLDENWQLNKEDAKDFNGFPSGTVDNSIDTNLAINVPCFAVMYKFRREYLDANVDAIVADHKGYCSSFKRLINSEVINLGKTKGVVLLWAGHSLEDKDETKADIMSFLEDDPLILKDVVEKWDLIDLEKMEANERLPPLKSTIQN